MKRAFTNTFGCALAVRFPRAALVVWLAALVIGGINLPSLQFDDDIQRAFASEGGRFAQLTALSEAVGGEVRDIIVLVEANDTLSPDDLASLRDAALELELVDGVAGVASPFSLRFAPHHAHFPGEPVFPVDLLAADGLDRLNAYEQSFAFARTMIDSDRSAVMFAIWVEPAADRIEAIERLEAVRAVLGQALGGGLRFTVTGEDAIAQDMVAALQTDLLVLNAAGSAFAFGVALAIFGGLRWALVAFVPAAASGLMALAIFAIIGLPVTVLNVIVPILVLVLALSDCMHLTLHLRGQSRSLTLKTRLARTIAQIAPANALTSLTTAVAFGAIAISSFEQLDELAVLGAVSVLASYWIGVVGFVVLAPFGDTAGGPSAEGPKWLCVPKFVPWLVFHRSGLVVGVTAATIVAGGWAALSVTPWFPLYQNLPESSQVRRAHRTVEAKFGGYLRLWSELDERPTTQAQWTKMVAVTEALRRALAGSAVVSLSTYAQWLDPSGNPPDADALSDLPPALRAQLWSGGTMRVIAFVPEPMHDRATLERYDRAEQAALAAGADRVVGLPAIFRYEAVAVIGELQKGLVLACLAAGLILAFAHRWPGLVLVLAAPNILPLLVATATLPLISAGQVNPTALLALTVAFGIAVDDSVHFINRFVLERAGGADLEAALNTAIGQTGRVMIATTMLICAGISSALLSDFSTVRLFGTMAIVTFIAALVADLVLLPVLLKHRWFRP